jgi:hypothetical protein
LKWEEEEVVESDDRLSSGFFAKALVGLLFSSAWDTTRGRQEDGGLALVTLESIRVAVCFALESAMIFE